MCSQRSDLGLERNVRPLEHLGSHPVDPSKLLRDSGLVIPDVLVQTHHEPAEFGARSVAALVGTCPQVTAVPPRVPGFDCETNLRPREIEPNDSTITKRQAILPLRLR